MPVSFQLPSRRRHRGRGAVYHLDPQVHASGKASRSVTQQPWTEIGVQPGRVGSNTTTFKYTRDAQPVRPARASTRSTKPLSATYSDGVTLNVAYAYRSNGQQATAVDSTGSTTYDCDRLGRLTSHLDGADTTIGYNLRGVQTQVVCPGAKTVARACDNAGRIDIITDEQELLAGRSTGWASASGFLHNLS